MISHPFGPRRAIAPPVARDALAAAGAPRDVAIALAAVGQVATGLDMAAVDTDQLHGLLRVGAFAINYFGPQYQLALRVGGRPAGLAAATVARQAQAAVAAWRAAGLNYWPEFRSGAWRGALSAAQARSVPATLSGSAPPAAIEATGQAAGVQLGGAVRSSVTGVQAATAAAQQLHNTIGATTNG